MYYPDVRKFRAENTPPGWSFVGNLMDVRNTPIQDFVIRISKMLGLNVLDKGIQEEGVYANMDI